MNYPYSFNFYKLLNAPFKLFNPYLYSPFSLFLGFFLKTLKKAKKGLFWGYPPKVQKWDKSGKKGPKTPFFCTLWSF